MNKIDMHFHSIDSDGNNSHDEILQYAQKKELEFITLTDHDVISSEFSQQAEQYGIASCEAVEISARNYEHNQSLHLTCYTRQFTQEVHDILSKVRDARKQNLELQVGSLQKSGFNISMQDLHHFGIEKNRPIESLNKYDIARILYTSPENKSIWIQINQGIDIGINNFYLQYFKREGEKFSNFGVLVPEYEPSLEVCKQIQVSHDAILSIAHPNFTFKKGISDFLEVLPDYIRHGGVNALEINSLASLEWIQTIIQAAQQYNLFITFGSDNHEIGGPDNKHADFGELNKFISPEFIQTEFERYRDKLGIHRKYPIDK